jgi:acyl carrier protein
MAGCYNMDRAMTETTAPLKVLIKQAIVRSLRLPIAWEEIGDATPLFDGGLGLDSIDVLELVLEIERTFGVAIADQDTGMRVLRSVDTIAAFIAASRSGKPA